MNDFGWWQRRLDDIASGIKKSPMSTEEYNKPQSGWYRVKRNGKHVAVTWWYENDGQQVCLLDFAPLTDPDRIEQLWQFACQKAVSKEAYHHYYENKHWPDESEAVIGDNRAPQDDSVEAIRDRFEDLEREAMRLINAHPNGAPDKDIADQASDLANRLGKLETLADDLRTSEKAPILQAGRDIDKKWNVIRDGAAGIKRRIKSALITPWLVAAEKAREATRVDGQRTSITVGTNERSIALQTTRSAKIVDRAVLLAHVSDWDLITKALQNIADTAARNKVALPGVEIIEERRAV